MAFPSALQRWLARSRHSHGVFEWQQPSSADHLKKMRQLLDPVLNAAAFVHLRSPLLAIHDQKHIFPLRVWAPGGVNEAKWSSQRSALMLHAFPPAPVTKAAYVQQVILLTWHLCSLLAPSTLEDSREHSNVHQGGCSRSPPRHRFDLQFSCCMLHGLPPVPGKASRLSVATRTPNA